MIAGVRGFGFCLEEIGRGAILLERSIVSRDGLDRTHIKWLQKYVGKDIPLFSIIVFSERCELKKVEVESTDVKVIKRDRTYATVREIWNSHEDTVEDVDAVYEKLKLLTNVGKAVKEAHIENVEKKNRQLICPWCGKELVLRTAKKGNNAGNQFYGCSGFPKCRYVKNTDK